MRKPVACSILLLALAQGPVMALSAPVHISNALSACMSIQIKNTKVQDNMVLANTTFQLHQPIAQCGCRSALVGYNSVTSVNTVAQVLQSGLIGVKRSGNKTLVLASEQALIGEGELQLQLQCAPAL